MKVSLIYVGLDVHQDSIVVAVARAGRSPAVVVDRLPNDFGKLIACLSRLGSGPRLRVCYEAGPTGYDLARRLRSLGIHCGVVAPSLMPVQPGRRIKTDRRDAARLAQLYRSGDLVEVAIPEPQVEAMRDLERTRDDAKRDERVARQRLDKFLLRHSLIWSGGTKWTKKHLTWIRSLVFSAPALTRSWASYLLALEQATARVEELTKDIGELVETWTLGPLTTALQALRGVQLVTAVTLAAEIGDFARFARPSQLMAYVGLVPSEHSSGATRRQGRITRTGNKHVRRLLVETAWNYRFRPKHSATIEARRAKASPEVRAIAEKAERRLVRRFDRLQQRGKPSQQVVTAIARELLGFVWAIAREQRLLAA
ncbi:MAG TPA: IS110 family transposase [Pirellulales bacterium]